VYDVNMNCNKHFKASGFCGNCGGFTESFPTKETKLTEVSIQDLADFENTIAQCIVNSSAIMRLKKLQPEDASIRIAASAVLKLFASSSNISNILAKAQIFYNEPTQ
jgi:hypothetical protein